jgi:hypothetical protein
MTSEGLGEMFEGDCADMCAEKFPLILIGGRAIFIFHFFRNKAAQWTQQQ